jgi:Rod binding domain-containing protein
MKIQGPEFSSLLPRPTDKAKSPAKSGADSNPDLIKLRKACRDFESIFISYMLKSMRKASEKSDLFGSGLGSDIYNELFDQKLADEMARSGQMKIGEVLFNQYAPLVETGKKVGPVMAAHADEKKPEIIELKPKLVKLESVADKTRVKMLAPKHEKTIEKPKPDEPKETGFLAKFEDAINDAAVKFGLSPDLLRAVIKHESGGNPKAHSPGGAKGLMQLIDSTAKMVGVVNPFNPTENIMGGAKYLSQLLGRFGGDHKKALASYNAGPAAVEKYGGVPPYKETMEYVQKVLATFNNEKNDN